MANPNHYETLNVRPSATTDEVRKAYHRLAREHHPDRFSDATQKRAAEQRFAAMTEAFNVLSNPARRREYDDKVKEASSGENPAEKEAKGYFRAGNAKLAEGNAKEAVRLFKAAIHIDPSQGPYHAAGARAHEADGAYGEAARLWEEAVKREPYNARYYRDAGQCLERAGMKIRARRMYESAVKWDKSDSVSAEALRRLGSEDDHGPDKKSGLLGGLFKRT
jgi:curved DNA-binding protein CbpA